MVKIDIVKLLFHLCLILNIYELTNIKNQLINLWIFILLKKNKLTKKITMEAIKNNNSVHQKG